MIYYTTIPLCVAILHSVSLTVELPTTRTEYGNVQGKYMVSRNGRFFSAFLGIPYAAPPIGQLRFLPSVSPQKWVGLRNFTEEGNICAQGKYGSQEDCLYVNIFTHHTEISTQWPVMFYIHGGSFYMGSPSLGITGPEYLMDRDIVLVTVRYRLGPFGFLSTEDFTIPGNMGLKDQVKALEWVKENIKYFGGDSKKVTLFGCSAGASSVHLHMQSPLSQNLFTRAISQSGTALGAYSLMGKGCAKKSTLQLARNLNCSTENSVIILQCLQDKTTTEIENAHKNLQSLRHGITKTIFRPVVEVPNDYAFLTESPLLAVTDKPWLVGITANEGLLNVRMEYLNYTIEQIKTQFNVYLPKALLFEDICSKPKEVANTIYNFYFKNARTQQEMMKFIERMYTDWWFLWPTEQAISKHNGLIYYYLYDHKGEHSYAEIYDSPKYLGVSHLDDLISLFRHTQFFPTLNEQDTNISRLIVDMWVNFATYENPTPLHISSNPQNNYSAHFTWIPFNTSSPSHLHIKTHNLLMQKGIYSERLEFWKTLNIVDKLP